MRTVPFYDVYRAVVSRHGMDPDGDMVPPHSARAITRAINRRTRIAWRAWDWPDMSVTEERPYRQVWNATHQYLRINPALPTRYGGPDEVFYISNVTYYQANPLATTDPPIGVPPGPANQDPVNQQPYWVPLVPLDPFVSFDQICSKSIGRVIGIYKSNPRLDGFKHSGITFKITENGIDLFRVCSPTIFVKYLLAPSKFTMVPWIDSGTAYNNGDLVFYPPSGETYVSIVANNTSLPGSSPNSWRLMPMPEVIAPYVEAGAYADTMRESHPVDNAIALTAMQKATMSDVEANDLLQSEIDVLMAMGQRHSYQQHRPPRRWTRDGLITTPTWQPGTVTTLQQVCESDGMYVPPVPPPAGAGVAWQWHPEIVSLSGPAQPSLASLATVGMLIGSKIEVAIAGAGKEYELVAGAADATDPGHVAPIDTDLVTNNKHWSQVS